MLLGETVTQISKERIISKIGSITDNKVQNDILNVYFANVTGKKRYNSVLAKAIKKIIKLIKEGEQDNGNAA